MKIVILGTLSGDDPIEYKNSIAYNSCCCIENNGKYFLVDGGGGNQILLQLKRANINVLDIHDVFISHNHPDHILGIIWVLKRISGAIRKGKYVGELNIYASDVTIHAIKTMRDLVFNKKHIVEHIKFNIVNDNEIKNICDMQVRFFDTLARKDKQFGFSVNNHLVVFAGDEPLQKENFSKFQNCNYLLHNAFCLERDRDKHNLQDMCHSSIKDACDNANAINARNLILWHSISKELETRKENYTTEAQQFFNGNIFVPNDLEVIDLNLGRS